jgi:hypothetical protein
MGLGEVPRRFRVRVIICDEARKAHISSLEAALQDIEGEAT